MDHILDAAPIAKSNNVPIVAIVELASYLGRKFARTIGRNIGGTVDLDLAKATMIHAFHTPSITLEDRQSIYGGCLRVSILKLRDARFCMQVTPGLGDLKMFEELYGIELAILPISGHFTMGPEHALTAAKWLGARQVLPGTLQYLPAVPAGCGCFRSGGGRRGNQRLGSLFKYDIIRSEGSKDE